MAVCTSGRGLASGLANRLCACTCGGAAQLATSILDTLSGFSAELLDSLPEAPSGNLNYDLTDQDVIDHFSQVGPVKHVR